MEKEWNNEHGMNRRRFLRQYWLVLHFVWLRQPGRR